MLAAEFPSVRVIRNLLNEGIAGWNRGFRAGSGEYFLVLDDDCYIMGDALRRAIDAARANEADLVSFEIAAPAQPGFYYNQEYDLGLLAFWGCAALITRRAIEQLDGFDPNIFVWAHEVEFTMRLLDRGFKHLYFPAVTAYHLKLPSKLGDILYATLHRKNQRHLAYGAGKLLRLRAAVAVLGNILMRMVIWSYHFRSLEPFSFIPGIVGGFWLGLRRREPVSRKTSAVYKRNFVEYSNPLLMLRSQKRQRGYRLSRPRYYPAAEASLQL
jgi:GT2 family glycosyltransferase